MAELILGLYLVTVNRPRTRLATLHRLVPEVRPGHEDMFDAYTAYISARPLDELGAQLEFIDVAGAPAIWIGVQADNDLAGWCADASMTTGLDLAYTDCRSAGVLLLGVDQTAYAMSYGNGHLLMPDELKDQRFGLRFLVRRLDSGQVHDLVRRRPDARGRTDSTLVPAGAPVWTLGIAENVEIIRRIGGRAKDLKVTFSSRNNRPVNVEGSAGLRMRFGVEPSALVADIRECERVCGEEEPDQALAFVEYVQPVSDADTKDELDDELERLLAGTDRRRRASGPGRADVGARALRPGAQLHDQDRRRAAPPVPSLELEDFLRRTRPQRDGERVTVLRSGHVTLNADDDGKEILARARADKWLEASVSLGSRRFFLMDGDWFEIGADYVRASREAISRLFPATPSSPPPWSLPKGRTEYDYNSRRGAVPEGSTCAWTGTIGARPAGSAQQPGDLRPARPGQRAHPRQARQGIRPAEPPVLPGPRLRPEPGRRAARRPGTLHPTVAALPRGATLPADFKPRRSCTPS